MSNITSRERSVRLGLGLLAATLICAGCARGEPHDGAIGCERRALRPTDADAGDMFRYAAEEIVESLALDGGTVRVHFTRVGPNALADGGDEYPGLVARRYESLLATAEQVWGYPRALSDEGLASSGGDGRFDVYLLDFGGRSDGAFRIDTCLDAGEGGGAGPASSRCIGYVVQENDFAGYGYPSLDEAVTVLASHEYFHAIQSALDGDQSAPISEGSAVWATERYAAGTGDFERFLPAFLAEPSRPLDLAPAGPASSSIYGTALFFQFLEERHGAEVIRDAWVHCQDGHGYATEPSDQANPRFLIQLDAALRERDAGFAQAFTDFALWNLLLGPGAVPDAGYREAAGYPVQAVEDRDLPVEEPALRVYYASVRALRVGLGDRRRLEVALGGEGGLGAAPEEVRAVLAFRAADGRTLGQSALAAAGGVSEVPAGATHAVVALVNGARSPRGPVIASRPSVCLGSEVEVAACLHPDAGTEDPMLAPTGLGCTGTGGAASTASLALALVLGRRLISTQRVSCQYADWTRHRAQSPRHLQREARLPEAQTNLPQEDAFG